ncbi:hypothetical protein ACF05T_22580 [Streptomyces lateritius]|uniref:Uncharacterized protein n=1 Tax=Streptomyces lateritius TaxID=67313 RepID=A0ABW6YGA4_9ACTN
MSEITWREPVTVHLALSALRRRRFMTQEQPAADAPAATAGKLTLEYEDGVPVVRVSGGTSFPAQIAIVGPDGEGLGTYTADAVTQKTRPLSLRPDPSDAPDALSLAEEDGLVPSLAPADGSTGLPASHADLPKVTTPHEQSAET